MIIQELSPTSASLGSQSPVQQPCPCTGLLEGGGSWAAASILPPHAACRLSLCWEAAAPAWGLWGSFQPKGVAIMLIILILSPEFKDSFTRAFKIKLTYYSINMCFQSSPRETCKNMYSCPCECVPRSAALSWNASLCHGSQWWVCFSFISFRWSGETQGGFSQCNPQFIWDVSKYEKKIHGEKVNKVVLIFSQSLIGAWNPFS